jgi:hypothetical protein
MRAERFKVQRDISAAPTSVFALLCDPQGHVEGMLQSAVTATDMSSRGLPGVLMGLASK